MSALTDVQKDARVDVLAQRFGVDVVQMIAGDSIYPDQWTRHFGWLAMGKMANGKMLFVYRIGSDHGSTDGSLYYVVGTSADGGKTYSINSPTLLFAATTGDGARDCNVCVLSNGNVLVTFFRDDDTTISMVRSTDNAVTFSAPQRITHGYTMLEVYSAPIVELTSGRLLLPVYVQNIGEAHSSARVFYSDDGGATWPGDVLLADGVADGRDYTEPGVLQVKVVQPGLAIGDIFALIRDDAGAMYESKSTNLGASYGALTNTGMAAHSAARILQMQPSGNIYWQGRPNALQDTTIFQRLALGSWTDVPDAPQITSYNGVMIYGTLLDAGGGLIQSAFCQQRGNFPNDFAVGCFRTIPEWVLLKQMPMGLAPASASINVSTTQQFLAVGAGNITWTLHQSAGGGDSVSSSGLYTAGTVNGVAIVRATDLNGYSQDATVTVSGASWSPANLPLVKGWFEARAISPAPSDGTAVTSTPDLIGTVIATWAKPTGEPGAPTFQSNGMGSGKAALQFAASPGQALASNTNGPHGLTNKLTAWAVVNANSLSAAHVVFGQAAAGYEWSIEGAGSGKVRFVVNGVATSAVSDSDITGANTSITCVWDGTDTVSGANVKMWINGVLQAATGNYTGTITDWGDKVAMGDEVGGSGGSGGVPFDGFIAAVGFTIGAAAGSDLTNLISYTNGLR